ncbi:MAG: N-acetyltransferase [Rhodospirillales bacterium]|nr:N-acetyltransferase [Rhodospirillales bacterium]
MLVRDSTPDDVPAITTIYAHSVLHGLASFEVEPPTKSEMAGRREAILAAGLPYLVAEADGKIAGYAYAGPYRTRPAYRHTVENSVYVDGRFQGRGAGRLLLAALIERCEAAGRHEMVAIIGDSGNQASIALHAALGFVMVGTLRNVGFKHERWLDSVIMQRSLDPR